ncbi:hypothetical protein BH11ACT4_BH11ACT4_18910 [soil metagenome]
MLLYLVRHGETDWNLQHRIQGSTDIPLNATGRAQAAATGALLARRSWDAVLASPLSRAYETAAIIADAVGLPAPARSADLVERNYGEAEGLTDAEIDARFPGDVPVPGRETREQVVERVLPALMAIAESHPGQSVIVVSHGGVIRSVLNVIDPTGSHGAIRNGSVHSFSYEDGSLQLIAFDDPIEEESQEPGAEDLEEQNELERRESARSRG